jgi:lambda family phage portal protein
MNWLDKAVAAVSPQAGLRRVRARAAMQQMQEIAERLSYDGAKPSRKSDGWFRPSTDANTEISSALVKLRDGARDLERNNPLAAKGCTEYEIKVVGTGITPQARTGDKEANKRLDDVFAQWAEQGNADGKPGYYGLQGLGFRSIFRDGEALLRHRSRQPGDGPFVTLGRKKYAIPYQVQLLESDFLDHTKTEVTDTGYIIQGVQFNKFGRIEGYWLYPSHPGASSIANVLRVSNFVSTLYSADLIEHGMRKQRTQVRGVTSYAPVMVSLHELDNYEQAEQTRKLIEACLTAFVYEPDDSGETLGNLVQDASGNKVESFEPGMIAYVKGGKQVQLSEPKAAGGYGEYMRTRHRVIAAGLNIPYEILTNDYSQSNYSSSRMGLVSFKKITEYLQWNVAEPFVCTPVWRRFIDACVVAGIVSADTPNLYAVEWAPPPFDLLDREAEALADIFELRIGKKTWPQLVGEQGQDPEKQLQTIIDWNAKFDAGGVILDCDPRKAARTGVAQKGHEQQKTPPGSALQHFEPIGQPEVLTPQHLPDLIDRIVDRISERQAAMKAPDITVNVPQSPPPNVTVQAPNFNVTTPDVHVNVEPANLTVNIPAAKKTTQNILRDDKGRMTAIETTENHGTQPETDEPGS